MNDQEFLDLFFPCDKQYAQAFLDVIAKTTDVDTLKYLNRYKEDWIQGRKKDIEFRKWRNDLADDSSSNPHHYYPHPDEHKILASKLREFADCIEKPGMHFAIGGVIPKLPLFKGESYFEDNYFGIIELTFVKGPLGG